MSLAVLFPGQGSQYIGMGKDLFDTFDEARFVFEEADDTLHYGLSTVIFDGQEEELKKTSVAQPALMTVCMAFMKVLEKEIPVSKWASFSAGHSLGEWTALTATKALSFEEGVKLLSLRGQFMQEAAERTAGGMLSVIGLPLNKVETLSSDKVFVANDNSIGQVVLSGEKSSLAEAGLKAKEMGAKLVVPLAVSGAFHSPFMQEASDKMQEVLKGFSFKEPVLPLIDNTTADVMTNPEEIKSALIRQITGRVRFTESVQKMVESGVTTAVEIGPGKVLTGLIRRIDASVNRINISSVSDVESFLTQQANLE